MRQAVLDAVCGWMAAGGTLKLSTRPGRMLRVVADTLPAIESCDRWTDTMTAVFASEHLPYWLSERQISLIVHGSGQTSVTVEGSARTTICELAATNRTDAVCQSLTVRCGESCFTFMQLGLAPGEMLRCYLDEHGWLSLTIDGGGQTRSVQDRRTPESSDELIVPCGVECPITVEADAEIDTILTVRGRWL